MISLTAGLAAPAVAACPAPEAIPAPRGEQAFVQTRTLKGLKKPMVSRGVFEVQGQEVVWTVREPIPIVTRISKAGVTQSVDGGQPEKLGPEGADAVLVQSGLMDLLRGDLSKLEARYAVKRGTRNAPEGWTLALTPKSAELKRWVGRLDVEGCGRIERISIRQANGDVMSVALTAAAG
jgi:hypothetical protein